MNTKSNKKWFYILLGPLSFIVLKYIGPPATLSEEAYSILISTIWIAIWWITEALPISVTALLPIILFPLTNAMSLSETTPHYGHKYVFLYLGGFILALSIEKWNLHKRIALMIIKLIGTNLVKIILGFMVATAFLSMWISNTATSVMMLPIGMAIITEMKNEGAEKRFVDRFGKALMLSIAYSASIGGLATLIGTPPNLVFAGVVKETYDIEITFTQWLSIGLPVSLVLLVLSWFYLTRVAFSFKGFSFPGGKEEINDMIKKLGPVKREEKSVLIVFLLTAFAWISRSFLLQQFLPQLDDTIIAVASAVVLFVIPSSKKGEKLIDWEDALKLPWGIILLFGGGLAIAAGFKETGLAQWIGSQLTVIQGLSFIAVILIIVVSVNFLTEITSNVATTAMLLPILAPLATGLDIHPYVLLVSATMAASCAFMLPVATPPNAVVFGSGHLSIPDMMRTGIYMNIISSILISAFIYFLFPLLWSIEINGTI